MLNKELQVNMMEDTSWNEKQALCHIKVWTFAMKEPFSTYRSMAMTPGNAEVKLPFFAF